MDWRAVSAAIAGVNVVVLIFNAWVTMRVQLAMAQLEKRIAEQRSDDRDTLKSWAEERFMFKPSSHSRQHGD